LVDLVVLGDSLVAKRRTTTQQIVAAANAWKGKGSRLARRAADLVRAGVDSPMETRLRMLMVLAGLPEPVVNHIEYDAMGAWAKRFDLSYPDLLLIIEYDGRQHAEDDRQWGRDIERREQLDTDGWRLIVVRSAGIYTERWMAPHRGPLRRHLHGTGHNARADHGRHAGARCFSAASHSEP